MIYRTRFVLRKSESDPQLTRHRRPSRDTGSAKQLPTASNRARAPHKLSPCRLRARPRLVTSFADHRPPPRAAPVIWTSAPGWGAIIDSLRANRRRERSVEEEPPLSDNSELAQPQPRLNGILYDSEIDLTLS